MWAAAAISIGWERTGAVLEAVKIGRREIVVRIPRRVLIIDLLGHDRRGWGMGHGRRGHHVGERALPRGCSGDWGVVRTGHRRRHGGKTGRYREGGPHLVVGEGGPDGAGGKRALC